MTGRVRSALTTVAIIWIALLTAACRSSAPQWESWTPEIGLPQSSKPQAKGAGAEDHILAMLAAASVDEKGGVVNPHFTFKPDERQITVVLQAGKVKGSPLKIAWYQITDAGTQKLFEHTIEVTTYDRAYSVGKNPGTLATGDYKVTATLEGETKEMTFDVAPQKVSAQPASTPDPPGQPPVDGGSGKTATPASSTTAPPRPTPQSAAGCQVTAYAFEGWPNSNTDDTADTAEAQVYAACADSSNLYVSAQGKELGALFVTPGPYQFGQFNFDPCSVPRGSDLPGAQVHFSVNVSNQSTDPGRAPIPDLVITLGDDTLAPRLEVKSTPARGTRVKAGDKISLKIRSYEVRRDGPWQSGVMDIQVTADPGGLVTSKDYMQYRGKSCNEKSWEQNLDATYTVPSDPPPIIKLCVLTEDFVGNQNSKCGEFRTGNKWNGKLHLVSSISYSNEDCSNETWDGEFSVVVGGPNGRDVQGKGSAHEVAPPQCNFKYPPPAMQTEFDVKGEFGFKGGFDRLGQFQLAFAQTGGFSQGYAIATFLWDPYLLSVQQCVRSPEEFIVPVIAPGDAEAQVSNSMTCNWPNRPGTAKGQMTVTMLCEDCK